MLPLLLACADPGPPVRDARETAADTAAPCTRRSATFDVPLAGARVSPYDVKVVPDLDGKGLADVIVPYGEDESRGFAVYKGESVPAAGPDLVIPSAHPNAQAGHLAGVAGDLDGDGLPELALLEWYSDRQGVTSGLFRWWSPAAEAEVARMAVEGASMWGVPPRALPDLDGDGVAEVATITWCGGAEASGVRLFAGGGLPAELVAEDAALAFEIRSARDNAAVSAAPDVDGDGLRDLLVPGADGDVHLLTAATFRRGGDVRYADLPLVVEGIAGSALMDLALLDVDDDGLPELFVAEGGRLLGWTGAQTTAALEGTETLTRRNAAVYVEGAADGYFGANVVPYTDASCGPGLAVSAHIEGRVYLFSNELLRGGGELPLDALLEGEGWTGYALGGGGDVDGDAGMDLAIATTREDGTGGVTLVLGP